VDRFRKLLDDVGFQILGGEETVAPDGRGWTEYGNHDQSGHAKGLNLARRIRDSSLLGKSLRGGIMVVGGLNLGGSLDPLHNAVDTVDVPVEKGASIVLLPMSARKQLFDVSDDMVTKVNIPLYGMLARA
jgi:predicted ATP-dependent Lon-type protease